MIFPGGFASTEVSPMSAKRPGEVEIEDFWVSI